MYTFSEFLLDDENNDNYGELSEVALKFRGQIKPKFNTVVIMAGGAGSGKGFVKSHLIDVEGITFDVDYYKTIMDKLKKIPFDKIMSTIPEVRDNPDYRNLSMEHLIKNQHNPKYVAILHQIIKETNIVSKREIAVFKSIASKDKTRKPNIIYDVTLKDLGKLKKISDTVQLYGYDAKDIHIVWIINHIDTAKEQNKSRSRRVDEPILLNTHMGVAQTMHQIVYGMQGTLKNYMDGDIIIVFNNTAEKDSEFVKSNDNSGSYMKNSTYHYIKRSGKKVMRVPNKLRKKIDRYVPNKNLWWNDK